MALDKSKLQTRVVSAAVFVVVILAAWFYNIWTFSLSLAFLLFFLLKEWTELIMKIKKKESEWMPYLVGTVGVLFLGFEVYFFEIISTNAFNISATAGADAMFTLLLYFSLISAALLVTVTLISGDLPRLFYVSGILLGLLFFITTVGLLIPLYSWQIPFLVLFGVWINDTTAYFVGSSIGKHKMSPNISPNKTWEGTIGGIVVTVLAAWIASYFYEGNPAGGHLGRWDLIWIALITAVTGTIGDLIESSVKRMAGVKDSGDIMPGHGGIYDRFDAFIFAVPWVAAYLNFFY